MIILVESLKSWVLEHEVEDVEITPCLNALIRKNSTLYAPYVQTQAGDGRSIDGQLLLLSGLYPLQQDTYSIKFPSTYYPSLLKATKQEHPTRSTCMIIDKKKSGILMSLNRF